MIPVPQGREESEASLDGDGLPKVVKTKKYIFEAVMLGGNEYWTRIPNPSSDKT